MEHAKVCEWRLRLITRIFRVWRMRGRRKEETCPLLSINHLYYNRDNINSIEPVKFTPILASVVFVRICNSGSQFFVVLHRSPIGQGLSAYIPS